MACLPVCLVLQARFDLFSPADHISDQQVVRFDPVNTASDMWSVGVLIYVLLSGMSQYI
jgi:hypothetical protein